MNTQNNACAPALARPLSELTKTGFRSNGSTITTADAWNLTVASVPAKDDPRRPYADELCRTTEERKKIVDLLAAAPELLAALKAVFDGGGNVLEHGLASRLAIVIAKAEGRA